MTRQPRALVPDSGGVLVEGGALDVLRRLSDLLVQGKRVLAPSGNLLPKLTSGELQLPQAEALLHGRRSLASQDNAREAILL
jgi:hypothetical protein